MELRHAVHPLCLLASLSGCAYSDHGRYRDDGWEPPGAVERSTVDVGATIEGLSPGTGTGAFVEVDAQGVWSVRTTCDSLLSGYACSWDLVLTVAQGVTLTQLVAEGLEPEDTLVFDGAGVRLLSINTDTVDGFRVTAPPLEPVRVDVYLDGYPGHRYLYWVGDGALHRGAPTNPFDLVPKE